MREKLEKKLLEELSNQQQNVEGNLWYIPDALGIG